VLTSNTLGVTAMKRTRYILERPEFDALLSSLHRRGHTLIGPSVRGGAIIWSEIASAADLPAGWTDEQDAGRYRLKRRNDEALFGYTVGPDGLKKFLLPPSLAILTSRRKKGSFEYADATPPNVAGQPKGEPPPKLAFIGVRACDLAGIAVLDKVLAQGPYPDQYYTTLRAGAFIVAVNCTSAGRTCFCSSMGTGPECRSGFDIALTEVAGNGKHYFVCESGSKRGEEVLGDVRRREAAAAETEPADGMLKKAASDMGRAMDTRGIRELLHASFEHPRWNDVAKRCLTCANCTMVCPTCFCSTVEDSADLAGAQAGRRRVWDSCFTVDYSYIHGGNVRPSPRARYRQWLTHKLGAWQDQFGMIGCVGCGRCITWCPVGIDITEEVQAIRKTGPSGPR
jgi:sulfhydrogenase subunit beta (sulfur reductase)